MKRIEALFLALGALVLAALLHRYGLGETLDALRPLGPWLPLLFALEAVVKALNAWGLRLTLSPDRRETVSFGEAFNATLQADAVNYLLPTVSLGGNALLIHRLERKVGVTDAAAAVTTANSAQTIAQFLFVLFGAALAAWVFPASHETRLGLLAITAVSAFVLGLTFAVQLGGPFGAAHSAMKRVGLRVPYLLEREAQIAAVDERLRESVSARPGDFIGCILLFGLGWAWSAVELAAVLSLMGIDAGLREVLAIEALAAFVDGIAFFMPAKAGAQEGGKALAFVMAGLSPAAGLAFGLFRRARELAWTMFGYLLLYRRGSAA